MPEVQVRKGEPVDRALKRLKTKLEMEGILEEVRRLRSHETPKERLRRKARATAKLQKDSTQIRGIHQSWLVFAREFNGILPTPGLIDRIAYIRVGDGAVEANVLLNRAFEQERILWHEGNPAAPYGRIDVCVINARRGQGSRCGKPKSQ